MKQEHIAELVRYRIQQADITLVDAQYLYSGGRGSHSVINRS